MVVVGEPIFLVSLFMGFSFLIYNIYIHIYFNLIGVQCWHMTNLDSFKAILSMDMGWKLLMSEGSLYLMGAEDSQQLGTSLYFLLL